MSAITSSSCSGTSTSLTSSGNTGRSVPAAQITVSSGAPHCRASASSFGPSPRNTPSSLRAERLSLSRFTRATRGLLRLVIRSALFIFRTAR